MIAQPTYEDLKAFVLDELERRIGYRPTLEAEHLGMAIDVILLAIAQVHATPAKPQPPEPPEVHWDPDGDGW